MTIAEARQRKEQVEDAIHSLLGAFEKDTGCRVTEIEFKESLNADKSRKIRSIELRACI